MEIKMKRTNIEIQENETKEEKQNCSCGCLTGTDKIDESHEEIREKTLKTTNL